MGLKQGLCQLFQLADVKGKKSRMPGVWRAAGVAIGGFVHFPGAICANVVRPATGGVSRAAGACSQRLVK
jgi:hypothetical protein